VSKLVIFRGDAVESELHLGRDTVRIGRDERNNIVLNDKSVSRFHAEVRVEGGTYFVVDLKSRNGVWMNGQQLRGKTALALGNTVTVGAYELTLEDDLSTAELGGEVARAGHTVVSAPGESDRPSRSATRRWSTQAPSTFTKRPALFWSGLAVVTLLICSLTYVVVRRMTRPPEPITTVAANPAPVVPEPPPPPPDPNKETIDQHMAAARDAFGRREFDVALAELSPVLDLDATNAEALELKRQVEEAKAAAPPPKPAVAARPEPLPEPEVPGIPKRNGESSADYNARVTRVKLNYQEGLRNVERQDFAGAFAKFEAVKRDQPGYSSIDAVIGETQDKQRKAVEDAIAQGQKSEQEGNLADAMRWYRQAQHFDAASPGARDRLAAVTDRATKEGMAAFTSAEVYRKRGDNVKAAALYKQAVDLLPNGPEKTQAQQMLEKVKP
jgi:tetratricopeptide (TPR) repeat protein